MYYVTLEDDGVYIYYSELKTRKLAEEYRNILVMYFRQRNFRIKVISHLCKTQRYYSQLDNYFEKDVVNIIQAYYNSQLTYEKFRDYFHG